MIFMYLKNLMAHCAYVTFENNILRNLFFLPDLGQDLVRCFTVRFDSYSFVRCRFTTKAKRTIQKSICQNLSPARSKVMF